MIARVVHLESIDYFLVSAVALVHPPLPHLAVDQALASVHLADQSNRGCNLEVRRQRRKLFMTPVTTI